MSHKLWIENGQEDPDKKLIITVSAKDYARIPNGRDPKQRHKVIRVRNLQTGKMFRLIRVPCGLDCWCALGLAPAPKRKEV